jgi:hypothetical protein
MSTLRWDGLFPPFSSTLVTKFVGSIMAVDSPIPTKSNPQHGNRFRPWRFRATVRAAPLGTSHTSIDRGCTGTGSEGQDNQNKDQPNDDNSRRARADISLHPSPIFGSVSFLVWMDRLPPIQELIFNKWIRGMPFIDSRNVRIGKAFESFFLGGAVSNQKNRWWKNRTKSSGHPNLASV